MRYIDEEEIDETKYFMDMAAEEAKLSKCQKSKRGAVIVANGRFVSKGFNMPTLEDVCSVCVRENIHDNSSTDYCPALHAEQMALLNALEDGRRVKGGRMYHIKLKQKDGIWVPVQSENPSCIQCSMQIKYARLEFVLWQKEGYMLYTPHEFNNESFKYFLEKKL